MHLRIHALVSVIISLVSFYGLARVSDSYKKVTNVAMPNLQSLNSMFLSYRSIRINLRSLGLNNLTPQQAKEYIDQVHVEISKYENSDKDYNSTPFEPGEEDLYKKMNTAWLEFKSVGSRALALQAEGTPEAKEKMNHIFLYDCPEAAKKFTTAVDELKDFHTKFSKTAVQNAESEASVTNKTMTLVSSLGILIGLALGFLFASSITKSISAIAKHLASNATEVTHSSEKIAESSQALSRSTTEQAASLQQTAASLEEITAMISKASEGAQSTASNSQASQEKAEDGRQAVEKMLHSMEEISQSNESILTQINESNRQMNDIVNVIQEIGAKTKVINEIVFQTKLLSFNASVEAARAGEHGKGFAVVAEEVGSLAQMSGNAAKEITQLLEGSIAKVESIVRETKTKVEILIESGREKVDTGVNVARDCSQILNEIVTNVSRVSQLSQEISQANREQSQGVSEINKAMAQLDLVTQQNSSASSEAATSAEQLADQANSLKDLVHDLLEVIGGSNTQETLEAKKTTPVKAKQTQIIKKNTVTTKDIVSRDDSGFSEAA